MPSTTHRRGRKRDEPLQAALDALTESLPRDLLASFLDTKLRDAGFEPPPNLAGELADRLLRQADAAADDASTDDDVIVVNDEITLTLPGEDFTELHRRTEAYLREELPEIVQRAIIEGAATLLRTLKRRWPEQRTHEKVADVGFRERLELRWGKAFDRLRMLLTISREMGHEFDARRMKSRARKTRFRDEVLVRLHIRACQITAEILALMEAGFADGAMARWRTLYEVGIVATLIAEHGDGLAERYLAHDAVETRRELDLYRRTYADLGYAPPSARTAAWVEARASAMEVRFGPSFSGHYGWAADLIGKKRPTFEDLEDKAGRSAMRAHYREASHNVHAGVKGVTFKLGALGGPPAIAGASNAGLDEPGQNTAITLTQITFAFAALRRTVDDTVAMKLLADLQAETVDAFVRVGRRLKREERERRQGVERSTRKGTATRR